MNRQGLPLAKGMNQQILLGQVSFIRRIWGYIRPLTRRDLQTLGYPVYEERIAVEAPFHSRHWRKLRGELYLRDINL
jgi:hypothetical protein